MNKGHYDYAIIGAGISGLSCAYYLLKDNPKAKIVVLEKSNHLGGKIKTQRQGGFLLEEAPDCFLTRKNGAVELCAELGILGELIGRIPENNKTYVKSNHQLYPLPAGITGLVPTDFSAIERCEFISKEGRDRFAQEPRIPVLESDEEESIAQFMSRRFGSEIYEKLIEPLMAGIYGGDGRELSVCATFPRLREMEKKYGSVILGLKKDTAGAMADASLPPFASFPNGMATLIETLDEKLGAVEILLNREVLGLEKSCDVYEINISCEKDREKRGATESVGCERTRHPERSRGISLNRLGACGGRSLGCARDDGDLHFQSHPEKSEYISAKNIVFACEAHATAKILEAFSPRLSALHKAIPYGSSVLVNLAFNKSDIENLPDSYGYLIPRAENPKILACTFTSQKWSNRAPKESVLIRVYMNRFKGPDILKEADESIVNLALAELSSTIQIKSAPLLTKIYRYAQSMPQYLIGHQARLKEIEAEAAHHKGLKFIGAAYQGVGIPDCIISSRLS